MTALASKREAIGAPEHTLLVSKIGNGAAAAIVGIDLTRVVSVSGVLPPEDATTIDIAMWLGGDLEPEPRAVEVALPEGRFFLLLGPTARIVGVQREQLYPVPRFLDAHLANIFVLGLFAHETGYGYLLDVEGLAAGLKA